jgi:hypothetical protein
MAKKKNSDNYSFFSNVDFKKETEDPIIIEKEPLVVEVPSEKEEAKEVVKTKSLEDILNDLFG